MFIRLGCFFREHETSILRLFKHAEVPAQLFLKPLLIIGMNHYTQLEVSHMSCVPSAIHIQ